MLKCYKSRSNTARLSAGQCKNRPRGYRTFFMLNSTEYEISTAGNNKNADCCIYPATKC